MNEYVTELKRAIRGRAICVSFIVFGVIFYIFTISLNIYLNNMAKIADKKADIAMTKLIGENLALLDLLNNKRVSLQVNEVTIEFSALEGVLSAFTGEQEKNIEEKEENTKDSLISTVKSFVKTNDLTIMTLSYFSLIVVFLTLFGIYDRRVKNILSYISSEQRFEKVHALLKDNNDDTAKEIINELYSSYISNRFFEKESYSAKPYIRKTLRIADRYTVNSQR